MEPDTPDFSGWATKNDLLCSDGRTIKSGAFAHMDKKKVPLIWAHQHNDPDMVLGYGILEHRAFGVYVRGYFNETDKGQAAKIQVQHGDVDTLSIFANNLRQDGSYVLHGDIKEVSLVLAGANPGAVIENIYITHGDTFIPSSEAIIYTGLSLEHADTEGAIVAEENKEGRTVEDIYNDMTEEQKLAVQYMVGEASDLDDEDDDTPDGDVEHSDGTESMTGSEFLAHIDSKIKEGFQNMSHNVFEQNGSTPSTAKTLSHDQIKTLMSDADRKGGRFSDTVLAHAQTYGIEDIEYLFPDAKLLDASPQFIGRRVEWVKQVLDGAKHVPWARIKSVVADITADEARAKGYVKGNLKKEEIFPLLKRSTSPTTIYKKQKLDRDDILDIIDLDVIAWVKAEMRLMLEEEIARAILIGDGRSNASDDKIKDPMGQTDGIGIRSIANDHEMYAHQITLPANVGVKDRIDAIIRSRTAYRGTGNPTFFTTDSAIIDMLLLEDKIGHRLYPTETDLAQVLRVAKIVTVEVMEDEPDILGILVNLADYSIGTDRGGQTTFFEDFDIDYNQNKYLYETRLSGALTKPKSAIVIRRQVGDPVTPTAPSFNGATNTITITNTSGVTYRIDGEPVTGNIVIEEDTTVEATANTGKYIPNNTVKSWTYTYTDAG